MDKLKRKLFWYDFKTWLVVGLCFPFGATVIGGLLLFVWFQKRQINRMFLEQAIGQHNVLTTLNQFAHLLQNSSQEIQRIRNEGIKLCKTCQANYVYSNQMCNSLQKNHPHYPLDQPPTPNPYRWFWFKINGYEPPPDDWNENTPFILKNQNTEFMRYKGRQYYENHKNEIWDMGIGDIPQWYIDRAVSGYKDSWN